MAKGQARHQKLQGSGGIHIASVVRYRWQWCRTARGRARHKTLQFQGAAGSLILLSSICSKGAERPRAEPAIELSSKGAAGSIFPISMAIERPEAEPAIRRSNSREQRGPSFFRHLFAPREQSGQGPSPP